MLKDRAMEILRSQAVIDVTYKNNAIWIESIDQQENTAQVKNLKTNKINKVLIDDLQEQKY